MVAFDLKVNEKQGTVYLPKWMREAWGYNLKIRPGLISGVVYPSGASLEDVIRCLKRIILKLEHEDEVKKKGRLSFKEEEK